MWRQRLSIIIFKGVTHISFVNMCNNTNTVGHSPGSKYYLCLSSSTSCWSLFPWRLPSWSGLSCEEHLQSVRTERGQETALIGWRSVSTVCVCVLSLIKHLQEGAPRRRLSPGRSTLGSRPLPAALPATDRRLTLRRPTKGRSQPSLLDWAPTNTTGITSFIKEIPV